MKKAIFLGLVALLVVFGFVKGGESKTKTYYSGDAVSYNNQVYVGSANADSLEVLKLEDGELKLIGKVRPFLPRFNEYGKFYDMKFSVENGRLFAFATSGFSLYKYEVVGDDLKYISDQKNNYWEWYTRLNKFEDNLVTLSDKGVKIWNQDLQVIDEHKFTNKENPYNVSGGNGQHILNVQGDYLIIYDRTTRTEKAKIALNYKEAGNRRAYQDAAKNVYVVDDYYAKKFNLDGKLLGYFQHADYNGYDVSASGHNDYIYFSNGLGVVKLDKNTMEEVGYEQTTEVGGAHGWAMGLSVVYAGGDKVVIFNNTNILVLDENLQKLASYESTEEANPYAPEKLSLGLDHNLGAAGAKVVLSGTGFFPGEDLHILFGGQKNTVITADSRGRFTAELTIPELDGGRTDIKVDGGQSLLTYSIDFTITD